ncbi:MAG TPA: sigma-54 dependent transcriptional regulator [Spirochaetia bacterium]|nr:sigma-54 dependent transcriptional regulator [Spirochaetia bacterium]
MKREILIVDDDRAVCDSLSDLLRGKGYEVAVVMDPRDAISALDPQTTALALVDLRMPGIGGMELLQAIKSRQPELPVVIITGYATVDTAVAAMKYGAADVFTKPIKSSALLSQIGRIMSERPLRTDLPEDERIVTEDPLMKEALMLLERAAATEAPILIRGETGTGKELAARMVHRASGRRARAFVAVNCAAMPDTLLESEMFGHERGAFTDARERKRGLLEVADGGTIFLDEIGEMSLTTQAKMLRVLQEKSFTRLGGVETIHSDCRLVAATNRNIEGAIASGRFREELYYRLAVVEVLIPPLRDRPGDVLPLAEHFLRQYERAYGRSGLSLSPDVVVTMGSHPWPGNVRELKNLVERAVIFCEQGPIHMSHLSPQYRGQDEAGGELADKFAASARKIIAEAVTRAGGSKSEAARILHIDRKTLYNRMKKLGMG